MILCVTPNPAIDHTLMVPKLLSGQVHRANESMVAAGGKGLNVARAIRTLGGASLCAGFLGGQSGRLLAALAEREGLPGVWTWIEEETRTCVIVVDADGATVINETGPMVTADDWGRLHANVMTIPAEAVCLSGSLPPGSPLDSFVALTRDLCSAGQAVWVDTSGPALSRVLEMGANIKVNGAEAGAVLGMAVSSMDEALMAANQMRQRGAQSVAITLGALGAVLVTREGEWFAPTPAVKTVSAVGSGDCFLGGLVVALTADRSPHEALRWAVAAGAANAISVGGGRFTRMEFEDVLSSDPSD